MNCGLLIPVRTYTFSFKYTYEIHSQESTRKIEDWCYKQFNVEMLCLCCTFVLLVSWCCIIGIQYHVTGKINHMTGNNYNWGVHWPVGSGLMLIS